MNPIKLNNDIFKRQSEIESLLKENLNFIQANEKYFKGNNNLHKIILDRFDTYSYDLNELRTRTTEQKGRVDSLIGALALMFICNALMISYVVVRWFF